MNKRLATQPEEIVSYWKSEVTRLRGIRKKSGITVRAFSEALNLKPWIFQDYESGKRFPSPELVMKWLSFLNERVD